MSGFLEIRPAGLLQSLNSDSDVSEAYGIPSAIDLFSRCGALSAQRTAQEGRRGGWGLLALAPEGTPEPADVKSLKVQRMLAQTGGTMLWPLPSALRSDGRLADIGMMCSAGEKLFCVPDRYEDALRLRRLFRYASNFDCRIAVMPSEASLCDGGQINEGAASDRLGVKGIPAVAEVIGTRLCTELAGEWRVPLHIRGVSCRQTLDVIASARSQGCDVTCDVAVPNLIFDDNIYDMNHFTGDLKLWPAVRTADDRAALWAAVESGAVNAIVSNSCPRSADALALPFEEVPFGSEILASAIPTLMTFWERAGRPCSAERLLYCLSVGPRQILGREVPGHTLVFRTPRGWKCLCKEERA
ncbi:MAG: hypothetical protein SOZ52_09105 [Pyramidobacter sp.]|nr:hypothetical protein [Pyramidobacter sp.]